jgi:hypothetical protein
MTPADVPRRIFEEFYSDARPVEARRADWKRQVTWRPSGARRAADQGESVSARPIQTSE